MGTSFSSEVEQPSHLENFHHDDDDFIYDYDVLCDFDVFDYDDDDHGDHMKPHHVQ